MSVSSFVTDDLFTFRITKALDTNPQLQFANSYEFVATTSGGEGDLLTLGTALVQFESIMMRTNVVFARLLVSTWQPDSKPYDPSVFISSTLTAGGARLTSSPPEPLNVCFSVSRQCASGRFGHIFYRGVLSQEDVTAPSGTATLSDRTEMQGLVDNAISTSGLDAYIGVGSSEALTMVLVGKTDADVRTILNLRAQGVSILPTNHAWFNRPAAP